MPILGGTTASSSVTLADRGAWLTATSYLVGDVVTQASVRYVCKTAHTSGTFATDLAALKWTALDPGAAVPLAQSGQSPAQEPVTSGLSAAVGSLAFGARADHVHPSFGLFSMFGTGALGAGIFDGSSSVTGTSRSGTTYTAGQDLHFTSLTISSGVTLNMDGYRLFVRGVLTCPSGSATITVTPIAPSGTNNSQQSGLTNTSIYGAGFGRGRPLGTGTKGANGGTGAGSILGALGTTAAVLSPVTGSSGNGGSGSGGAGGTGGNHGQGNWDISTLGAAPCAFLGLTWSFDTPNAWNNAGVNVIGPVHSGRGGASGGGDGTNSGGCGGCGGGVLVVNAMYLSGTVNLTAPGGAGGTPTTGNCGGGGGGTGGVAILNTLDRSAWTGTATAPGGAAGTGVGTGTAGTAGAAGFVQSVNWA